MFLRIDENVTPFWGFPFKQLTLKCNKFMMAQVCENLMGSIMAIGFRINIHLTRLPLAGWPQPSMPLIG
jgi:hypothetical protein